MVNRLEKKHGEGALSSSRQEERATDTGYRPGYEAWAWASQAGRGGMGWREKAHDH